jgi:hypothetical protein
VKKAFLSCGKLLFRKIMADLFGGNYAFQMQNVRQKLMELGSKRVSLKVATRS